MVSIIVNSSDLAGKSTWRIRFFKKIDSDFAERFSCFFEQLVKRALCRELDGAL